jgi:hypothetical protein
VTDLWRKIEAALDAYFRDEGWSLDALEGDHIASCQSFSNDEFDDGTQVSINTTECAKRIAAEVAQC